MKLTLTIRVIPSRPPDSEAKGKGVRGGCTFMLQKPRRARLTKQQCPGAPAARMERLIPTTSEGTRLRAELGNPRTMPRKKAPASYGQNDPSDRKRDLPTPEAKAPGRHPAITLGEIETRRRETTNKWHNSYRGEMVALHHWSCNSPPSVRQM